MTTSISAGHGHEALFIADFYPELGEYLAERHAAGYDADSGRARFLAWLTGHPVASPPATEPLRDYLARSSRVPPLTAGQETELAVRIQAGRRAEQRLAAESDALPRAGRLDLEQLAQDGQQARIQLVEANLRLVVPVAKRFAGRGVRFLDLVRAGNLGLIRAVDRYDPSQGYRFGTYATWWIRQAITRVAPAQP